MAVRFRIKWLKYYGLQRQAALSLEVGLMMDTFKPLCTSKNLAEQAVP